MRGADGKAETQSGQSKELAKRAHGDNGQAANSRNHAQVWCDIGKSLIDHQQTVAPPKHLRRLDDRRGRIASAVRVVRIDQNKDVRLGRRGKIGNCHDPVAAVAPSLGVLIVRGPDHRHGFPRYERRQGLEDGLTSGRRENRRAIWNVVITPRGIVQSVLETRARQIPERFVCYRRVRVRGRVDPRRKVQPAALRVAEQLHRFVQVAPVLGRRF